MTTQNNRQHNEIKHVYRMVSFNPVGYILRTVGWWIIFTIIFLSFFSVLKNMITIASETEPDINSVLSWLALILSAWLNALVRIIIYEDRLEYHDLFDDIMNHFRPRTFSTWENLSHIGLTTYSDSEGNDGHICRLYLKNPNGKSFHIGKIFVGSGILSGSSWYGEGSFPFIDIQKLTQTGFGRDLLLYAPHVIETTAARTGNQSFAS